MIIKILVTRQLTKNLSLSKKQTSRQDHATITLPKQWKLMFGRLLLNELIIGIEL